MIKIIGFTLMLTKISIVKLITNYKSNVLSKIFADRQYIFA